MRKEIFGNMRKRLAILLLVLFVMSVTAETVCAKRVKVCEDPKLKGDCWEFNGDKTSFPWGWNDDISSIEISQFTWRFYKDIDYGGSHRDFTPGRYDSLGFEDDQFSSAKIKDRK